MSAIRWRTILLGFQAPISGRIESITGGISAANAASSTQGLPSVDPIFTWVRLAQRIPVRIRIEHVPPDVPLVAGMTCSVSVFGEKGMPVARRERGALLSAGKLALGIFNERTKRYRFEGSWLIPLCDMFLALVILIAVRFAVGRLGLRSMFANPPLAEAALYVCILGSLIAFWI